MSELSEIVNKEKFLNAFKICQEYCINTENIIDVNFRMIKDHLLNLTAEQVASYYDKFILSELVYGIPELHSCEAVTVPKKSTGVREYRFFPVFSMILYNAVGLTFVDSCNEVIGNINFNKKNIFPFYPTKFILNSDSKIEADKWKVKNDYKTEFNKYQKTLEELVTPNTALLQLDLTQYFESIVHEKLISLIYVYSNQTTLSKNKLDAKSEMVLEFYFEALMNRRFSIPQGRKNFVSDYLGYLYLVPFDMIVEELCRSHDLEFTGMIRYVDDITIVFNNTNSLKTGDVYRTLLIIESKIINWFLNNLGLTINPAKTIRKIITNQEDKSNFIEENRKSTSGIELIDDSARIDNFEPLTDAANTLSKTYERFLSVLMKFKFPEMGEYRFDITKDEREVLKVILTNKSFQNYILAKQNEKRVFEVLNEIEIELIVDYVNILIVIFFLSGKSKKMPYRKVMDNFLQTKLKTTDKRHIHILHILLAQKAINHQELHKVIKRSKSILEEDNYGKYLLFFANGISPSDDYNPFENESIYHRLSHEYSKRDAFRGGYLFNRNNKFQLVIKRFVNDFSSEKAIADQLKHFVIYRRQKKWDLAFNHLHNLFHQVCKTKYLLKDTASVKNIIDKSQCLSLTDQLDIDKFYNRRNFNMISHPSQKEQPSEKVTAKDLEFFESRIFAIINKILQDNVS